MSKFNSVKRNLLSYPAIIKTLLDLALKKDVCVAGLLIKLRNIRIIAHMLIMTDIAFIVDPLNTTLQKRDLDLNQLEATFKLTCLKLEDLMLNRKLGKLTQIQYFSRPIYHSYLVIVHTK